MVGKIGPGAEEIGRAGLGRGSIKKQGFLKGAFVTAEDHLGAFLGSRVVFLVYDRQVEFLFFLEIFLDLGRRFLERAVALIVLKDEGRFVLPAAL